MKRRLSIQHLQPGTLRLESAQAHYLRDVLRLGAGDVVELFDAAGRTAMGTLARCDRQGVELEVERVEAPLESGRCLTIAAAVPKGQRADWMVEKLCELGVDRFIPLQCRRSVVVPGGRNKIERWERLAGEAARQSHRRGVMRILPAVTPGQLLEACASEATAAWHLSTAVGVQRLSEQTLPRALTLMIGPEGGWSEEETALFKERNAAPMALTSTVLRVETAAIVAAALAVCRL